jgi:hypothetical protein
MGTLSLKSPEKAAERLKLSLNSYKDRSKPLQPATVRADDISINPFISLKKEPRQSVESWICQTFPKTFNKMQPLPLATGIQQAAIQAMPLTLNSAELVSFLRQWTRSPAYLEALAEPGAMRCDLNSNPIEPVKDGVKKWAEQMLLTHRPH